MTKSQESEQYTFRKERRENWTTVDNAIFDTEKLSLGAIGLACLILSKPATWQVKIDYLAHICREGEKAIRAHLKELAVAGYMMRVRKHDQDGRVRTITLIADYPRFIEQGTPDERIKGYDTPAPKTDSTDLPSGGGSVESATSGMDATDLPSKGTSVDSHRPPPNRHVGKPRGRKTEGSENRHVGNREVLVSTDQVNTDLARTDTSKDSSSSPFEAARVAEPAATTDEEENDAQAAVYQAWRENMPQELKPILKTQICDLIENTTAASVIHGIVKAVERGALNFSYVAACARAHAKGLKSPANPNGTLYSPRGQEPRRNYRPAEYADIILGAPSPDQLAMLEVADDAG